MRDRPYRLSIPWMGHTGLVLACPSLTEKWEGIGIVLAVPEDLEADLGAGVEEGAQTKVLQDTGVLSAGRGAGMVVTGTSNWTGITVFETTDPGIRAETAARDAVSRAIGTMHQPTTQVGRSHRHRVITRWQLKGPLLFYCCQVGGTAAEGHRSPVRSILTTRRHQWSTTSRPLWDRFIRDQCTRLSTLGSLFQSLDIAGTCSCITRRYVPNISRMQLVTNRMIADMT